MIAIGADHGGFKLKEEVKKYLDENGIEYKDFGTYSEERAEYPLIARDVSKAVQSKEFDKGILVCRSGYGMSLVANKFKGIRSVPAFDESAAKFSRMHNDSNILAFGADYITTSKAIQILRIWLATEFEGGRHAERLKLIEEIENKNMK